MRRIIGRTATQIELDGIGRLVQVVYHDTAVVTCDYSTGTITLCSGGWRTVTTKRRMNETDEQFRLGFRVWQRDFAWYVDLPNRQTVDFYDGMTFQMEED